MVHYITHKTSWYTELIQLSDFLLYGSVFELLARASNFHCPSYIIHSKVVFIVKKLVLFQSSIKRANAPGIYRYCSPGSRSPKCLNGLDPHGGTSSNQL